MKEPFGGIILNVAFRMLIPFTIVYGVYVLCLGEFFSWRRFPGRCPVGGWCFTGKIDFRL